MPVILVTQEVGSRGDEIAERVATRLGLKLVAQEQTEQRVVERVHISRFIARQFCQGAASLVEHWTIRQHRLLHRMTVGVASIAVRGTAMAREWRATSSFRPARHVIRVHVCAPKGKDTAAPATALCCRSQQRAGIDPPLFVGRCDNRSRCDLVLDSERMPVDECVERVCRLALGSQFKPVAEARVVPAGLVEVDVAGETIRLPMEASQEDAIARVEAHLRGGKSNGGFATLGSFPMGQHGVL